MQATDEVFIPAPPKSVQLRLLEVHLDPSWWSGLRACGDFGWVELDMPVTDHPWSARVRFRADITDVREWEGFTWRFTSGDWEGQIEAWLEGYGDGTIVHMFIDAEPGGRGRSARQLHRLRWSLRRGLNALRDDLVTSEAREEV